MYKCFLTPVYLAESKFSKKIQVGDNLIIRNLAVRKTPGAFCFRLRRIGFIGQEHKHHIRNSNQQYAHRVNLGQIAYDLVKQENKSCQSNA